MEMVFSIEEVKEMICEYIDNHSPNKIPKDADPVDFVIWDDDNEVFIINVEMRF